MKKAKKGLTLVEIIVVLIIVVIVTVGFGTSASKQVKRTNREAVSDEMQVIASNMSDAYYDLGNKIFEPGTDDTAFRSFLNVVMNDYLGIVFDLDPANITATSDGRGYEVTVESPLDVYEQHYKCFFITSASAPQRYFMLISGGENGIVEMDGYKDGNYSDDIVLIVQPKES